MAAPVSAYYGCELSPEMGLVPQIDAEPACSEKSRSVYSEILKDAGVLAYWLAEPNDKAVFVYVLQGEEYIGLRPQTDEDTLISRTFPELAVDLAEVLPNNVG